MKEYESPEIKEELIKTEDICTVSDDGNGKGDSTEINAFFGI